MYLKKKSEIYKNDYENLKLETYLKKNSKYIFDPHSLLFKDIFCYFT